MKDWRTYRIGKIGIDDSHYPENLKNIKNPPRQLYFRGEWNDNLWVKTLSIVGSRRMTRYGGDVIKMLIPPLISQQVSIISGFMFGVDAAAHRTCVEYGGKTVAVLGGGLDFLTPSEHDGLYSQILDQGGLVISEYEANFKPTLWSFPQRNRIVSGLATIGVVVVEAGIKSGSLITAKLAIEQDRQLFAVPGPINSSVSAGTNWLIATQQADAVTEIDDIIYIKRPKEQQMSLLSPLSGDELAISQLLENEALSLDEIARFLKQPVEKVSQLVSLMTIKNIIEEENGAFRATKI